MARTYLTSHLTIYVNASTGSDLTGDGSSGFPLKTLQFSHDYVQQNYDLANKYSVTYVGTGTFTAGIVEYGSLVGQCSPSNQVFTFTSGSSVDGGSGTAFGALYGIGYMVDSATIKATGTDGVGVSGASGSTIALNTGITFGACGASAIQTAWGGNVYINNSISISGNGSQFLFASGGVIQLAPSVVSTWTAATHYSNCYAWAYGQGVIGINGQTFTGAVTGTRYKAELLGLIATGTSNLYYLPGNAAGGTSFGGIYW
jgi:hypothetical protein